MPYTRFQRPVRMCQDRETGGSPVTAGFRRDEPADGAAAPRRAGAPRHHAAVLVPSAAEDRVYERLGVERRQVVGPLAEADQLDGDAELALHGDHDAALGG